MISKALLNSYINHEKFVLVNSALREYNEMKEEIQNSKNVVEYTIKKQWKRLVSLLRKILGTKFLVSEELNEIN